ncbi:hypothetical protein RND71_002852 [Anisodus tanguticus]|uniref:BURP domain-containing protein n=1 Tax=Anisodus tanguticus TaxID=243964 RepID=A0AAE1VTR7_9SOLA|nr:hypothetical protein RND71_002852 [Anisodus tanguticus]
MLFLQHDSLSPSPFKLMEVLIPSLSNVCLFCQHFVILILDALHLVQLAFVASTHAAISPEVYWKVKLPNTQIPKVIKDFVPQSDNVVPELKQDNTKEKVYYGLSGYIAISWHHAANSAYGRLVLEKVNPIKQVTEGIDDGPLKQYFLLEKDLEKGNVINFPSLLNKNEAPFLPRKFAESIPFSMEKFLEILNHFSIDSKSKDAQAIEKTIKLCEEPEVKHKEKRTCVASLESMVDFGLSVLGTNDILAITSEVQGETQNSQRYTIEQVQQIADGDNMSYIPRDTFTNCPTESLSGTTSQRNESSIASLDQEEPSNQSQDEGVSAPYQGILYMDINEGQGPVETESGVHQNNVEHA